VYRALTAGKNKSLAEKNKEIEELKKQLKK
jgi:hypothetical protein